jgi:uncharacterized protein (DUF2236 family)
MQRTPTDHGLFGPDSVTWRVHTDPLVVVGGFCALHIQALHPPSMWGTFQNSRLIDPEQAYARLRRTTDFVAVRTFGCTEEVERVGRRVRKLHARLRGRNPETGEVFRIDDPENLMWVHCGEVLGYLAVARAGGVRLSAAEQDRFVDEQRRAAEVVGLDPAVVPGSVAELDAYVSRMLPELRVTREVLLGQLGLARMSMPVRELPALVGFAGYALLGLALLPSWARALYRLPSWELAAPTSASLRALRLAIRSTPPGLRGETPLQQRYLREARRLVREQRTVTARAA